MRTYYWYMIRIDDFVVVRRPPKCSYTEVKAKNLADANRHVKELLFCREIVKNMKKKEAKNG